MSEAMDEPADCTAEFMLMKVPRRCGWPAAVMIAMPGTKRPLTRMKNGVVMHSTPHQDMEVTCVIARMGSMARRAMMRNTRGLPYWSDKCPNHLEVKKMNTPPARYKAGSRVSG